jgi:hypothetical protein
VYNSDIVIGYLFVNQLLWKIKTMKLVQPLVKTDPLNDMDHLRTMISHETFSMAGIANSLQNLMPSIQKNFQSFIHNFSRSEPAVQLKSNERDFMRLLDGRIYLNLSPLIAYVPEGLEVAYIEYLMLVREAVQHCHTVTMHSLNEYSMYLAQIITNRQLKVTTMPHDALYAKMEKSRTELNKRLSKCFKMGSSRAERTYGDVVDRNADWPEVFKLVTEIDHLVNTINRDDLHKKAEECNTQLGIIIKQIRNNEFEGAGPEVVNNLASGAYQVGAELELFAATYFRTVTINTAIGDTMNKISQILKDMDKSK